MRATLRATLVIVSLGLLTSCSNPNTSGGLAENVSAPPIFEKAPIALEPQAVTDHLALDTTLQKASFCKAKMKGERTYESLPKNKILFRCHGDSRKMWWYWYGQKDDPSTLKAWSQSFCKKEFGKTPMILDVNNSACGGGGGTPTQGGYSSADWNRLWALNAGVGRLKGRTKRWPSRSIRVSGSVSREQKAAASKWTGFNFSYGPNGKIIYYGFKHPGNGEDPRLAGWAIPLWRSNGQMYACGIWLSSIHPHMSNPDAAAVIFEHEIGHCLGILGHLRDGGIMEPSYKSAVHTRATNQLIGLLYSLPAGTKVSSKGKLSRSERSQDEDKESDSDYDPTGSRVYQGPTIYFYSDPQ